MLRPKPNRYRQVISLNGLWSFQTVSDDYTPVHSLSHPQLMAVPASYQELTTHKSLRDYVGKVCYETIVEWPNIQTNHQLRLYIGAAGHRAEVYLDGKKMGVHNGHFLPIDLELSYGDHDSYTHRLSIVLDNRLDFGTLPIGEVKGQKQIIHHDFANLTGIHRDVLLYTLPENPITDIKVETNGYESDVRIDYEVITLAKNVWVELIDPKGQFVTKQDGSKGQIIVNNPLCWDIHQGWLYQLIAHTDCDAYALSFGIRDIAIQEEGLYLNGRKVFLKGFGMHEDHSGVGKASISALNLRDFELLKWINANSFRTSHYPYSDEMMDLADRYGLLVIDEVPAVGLNYWSSEIVFQKGSVDERTLAIHKQMISELITRDRHHPSVFAFSLANEANTYEAGAVPYFEKVFAHARTLTQLPLMIVENVGAEANKVAQFADIIGLNRYQGWYVDLGDLATIDATIQSQLNAYHERFHKPMMLTEFGADTLAGLHKLPSVAFSEEYQVEFLDAYHQVIKKLPYVIGEHVWNFADFLTKEGLTRMDGNKKGVFTRDRQPKMVAHFLKKWWNEDE